MKRILIINNEFPPVGAGAGTASYYFSRQLSELGHHVTVVTASFKSLPAFDEKLGFNIYRVKCLRTKRAEANIFELLSYTFSAIRVIHKLISDKKETYDSSICFHAIPAGMVGYRLFKKYSIPYIVMLRGGDVPGFLPERFKYHHRLTAPLTKTIWQNARHLIANSQGLKILADKTANRIGRGVAVIQNGVDMQDFQTAHKRHPNMPYRLIFTGRFEKQKGLQYLFKAISLIPETFQKALRLDLFGDGPDAKHLELEARKLKNVDIRFRGYVKHEQVKSELRESDIFILPSLYEGMSNSLLEAMATGLPAVVTDIMGNNELIRDGYNGLVVPPKDPVSLRDAIIKFIKTPELFSLFRKNTLSKIRSFGWSRAAGELDRLLLLSSPYSR